MVFAATATCVFAQPYSGTIFNFPNSFLDTDPSALTTVVYVGQQQRNVYDRRPNGYISMNAYIYTASFNDGANAWSIMVNPEFSQTEATALAAKYARNIGQIPHCIRAGVTGAVIHNGNNPWGGGDPLTIHHGQGLSYESQGIVTETMIHESTHAGFDRQYYTADWNAAANADGQFISTYARDYPTREDHAETFLCWLVARHKRDRISATDYTRITTAVPNRLRWYDGRNFNLSPVVTSSNLASNAGSARTAPFTLLRNNFDPGLSRITIGYKVDRPSRISLQILDMEGRIIKTLAQERATPGSYQKVWDTRNDAGQWVSGGNYLYRLMAGEFQAARSMALYR